MPHEYKPRLSVVIDQEDFFSLRNHLPIGFQKVIFNLIVKDLIKIMDKFGANQVVAAFCNQDISLDKMCRLNLGGPSGNNTQSKPVYNPDDERAGDPDYSEDQEG